MLFHLISWSLFLAVDSFGCLKINLNDQIHVTLIDNYWLLQD